MYFIIKKKKNLTSTVYKIKERDEGHPISKNCPDWTDGFVLWLTIIIYFWIYKILLVKVNTIGRSTGEEISSYKITIEKKKYNCLKYT